MLTAAPARHVTLHEGINPALPVRPHLLGDHQRAHVAPPGFGRRPTSFREIVNFSGLRDIRDFPNIADAMAAGWSTMRIDKLLGQNWLNLFDGVWRK